MKASTLPRYLVGSREAILELAASRSTLFVGFTFVLSAGLAREYDGEDLLHEPWHALRPLAASLVSGTALFLVVDLAARRSARRENIARPAFFTAWRSFLGLFWMTAPMAWLYAVPYERFSSPVDAVVANLWTLGLVAAWRVLLMVRVVQVVYGIRSVYAFFLVMLFADAVTYVVLSLAPAPVIGVMGGVRPTEREALVSVVTLVVTGLAAFSAPIWILGAIASSLRLKPNFPDLSRFGCESARGAWWVATGAIVVFVPLLLFAQPEQVHRREIELLLEERRVAAALASLSARSRDDFPPHWNPPPEIRWDDREGIPTLDAVRDAMSAEWPAAWVADIYLAKLERSLRIELTPGGGGDMNWEQIASSLSDVEPRHAATARFLLEHHGELFEADLRGMQILSEMAPATDIENR